MNFEAMKERLFPMLVTGDRVGSRAIVSEALDAGVSAENLTQECYWPLLDMINTLYRQDKMASLAHHYSTRLLRSLVDQAQANYKQQSSRGRNIMLFCGETEVDDLAAQMVADLAEADGYTVNFGGGGVSWDEIMNEVNTRTPDVLLLFSSAAVDAPNIRILIDSIRDIGACPGMQIAVGGGVFNRAEGLAQEIGADLWATTPRELIASLGTNPEQRATPEQRTVGRRRGDAMAA
ncbi:MAG: cobalamin B12-binding domain-containing protein [Phycisphaerales bacterium]|nr:cobalamin B12-binding domain-containing protein [Phycisphaerales bacterium]